MRAAELLSHYKVLSKKKFHQGIIPIGKLLTLLPEDGIFYEHGELSERFKEPVLKTGDGETHREFESHTLRQIKSANYCL